MGEERLRDNTRFLWSLTWQHMGEASLTAVIIQLILLFPTLSFSGSLNHLPTSIYHLTNWITYNSSHDLFFEVLFFRRIFFTFDTKVSLLFSFTDDNVGWLRPVIIITSHWHGTLYSPCEKEKRKRRKSERRRCVRCNKCHQALQSSIIEL